MPTCDDGPAVGRRKERGCKWQQPLIGSGKIKKETKREKEGPILQRLLFSPLL